MHLKTNNKVKMNSRNLIKPLKLAQASFVMLAAVAGTTLANAATVTVTVEDNASNVGAVGTFYWAITNANPGDTIAFNLPGASSQVHYLKTPLANGFPLVYKKHNLTIDGYTQPGASANTNPLTSSNNAVIKVVIDGRDGGATDMRVNKYGTTSISDPYIDNTLDSSFNNGFTGANESALLGVYRSTNVNIRGLAFLGTFSGSSPYGGNVQKGLCIAQDWGLDQSVKGMFEYTEGSSEGCHINGCWFGVDPGDPTTAGCAGFRVAITSYRQPSAGQRPTIPNVGLIIGVAPGSANPRAEFNVMAGVGCFASVEGTRGRISGNFIGVMPDGVTGYNFPDAGFNPNASLFRGINVEIGGRVDDTVPYYIGTDGDGVNDADEGNLWGPLTLNPGSGKPYAQCGNYDTKRRPYVMAGNVFGLDINGNRWPNCAFTVANFNFEAGSQVRFGSDFNGVSDALEANTVYNMNVFSSVYPAPASAIAPSLFQVFKNVGAVDAWLSVRGNKMVNNYPLFAPDDTSASKYVSMTNYVDMDLLGFYPLYEPGAAVPVLTNSTVSLLKGTCPPPAHGYTNLVVDVYVSDDEGNANGALFNWAFFAGTGFNQGKTYLGTFMDNGPYDSDPAVGAFSLNIASLGIQAGTKVTAAVTYSTFVAPALTGITRSGGSTTLQWTGDNGGPYPIVGVGGAGSGFGVQRAATLNGPWTTVAFAPGNSITLADASDASFYRVAAPVAGMTTLFAAPVTLAP